MPKVIDFGIAKATHHKLTEKTLFTQFAIMIGTPAFLSPEQAEISGLDIDTRTDIYASDVLLYALLTGTTPFPEKRLLSLAYGEIQRVILEKEPERPSTRLSTLGDKERTLVARNCGEDGPGTTATGTSCLRSVRTNASKPKRIGSMTFAVNGQDVQDLPDTEMETYPPERVPMDFIL